MQFTEISHGCFINLEKLVLAQRASDGGAQIVFENSSIHQLPPDAADGLFSALRESRENSSAGNGSPASRTPRILTFADLQSLSGDRKKAWYVRTDGQRHFVMAFVNQKGSCSVRTYDATTGTFLSKRYSAGNYQDNFQEFLTGARPLSVDVQPNLERDCKHRLPEALLADLQRQIVEL